MWLAAHSKRWTADRLAKRGLAHTEHCPLCDQEETINHLLLSCVFSRQIRFYVLEKFGLQALAVLLHNLMNTPSRNGGPKGS
jgi:hypothetical protein